MNSLDPYAPHVAPINRLIDSLIEAEPPVGRGWMPYVSPVHGGVTARVLSVLRDPGPKTLKASGSGYLSVAHNDDPTSAKQREWFGNAGISMSEVTPWNAYPWYINAAPTGPQITEGLVPLRQVIELMSDLRIVLLQGGEAKASWRKLVRREPHFVRRLGVLVVPTFHPGNQALKTKNPEERQQRISRRIEAMREVATILKK